MLGSGALIVIDDRTCMVQLALRLAEFYRHESCGKCTPCREGTRWMVKLLKRIAAGAAQPDEIDLLVDVVRPHRGQVPVPARRRLRDAGALDLQHFRHEFEPASARRRADVVAPRHALSAAEGPAAVRPMATSRAPPSTVTIDGREVQVPPGTPLVVAAAQAAGSRSRSSATSRGSARPSAPAACAWSRSRGHAEAAGRLHHDRSPTAWS